MPHLGEIKFKALHKQKSRLSMRRNQGKPGQWSARKAQLLAKEYKAKGGGYK